jgi:Arc/MetJ family transcription regulator
MGFAELRSKAMRSTITLDDDLLEKAGAAIGSDERAVVLREGLKALIEREAARRLIRLGGSAPSALRPPRRRSARLRKAQRGRA